MPGCLLWERAYLLMLSQVALLSTSRRFATAEGINPSDIESDTSLVEVVEGFNASLPCAILSAPQYDVPVLTLWYIGDQETPVYSHDQREPRKSFSWSEESVFGGRAKFLPREHPPVLMLTNVTTRDHRLYRCRVDYHKSNSRQAWVKLTVIVPPKRIEIIPKISPVKLGQRNDVICRVTGGSPLATIEWLQEGQVVDGTSTPTDDRMASDNSLDLKASRKDITEPFTCKASNNKFTPVLQAFYQRNVTCEPLSVTIVPEEKPLVAGRMVKLVCTVIGSNPPALVTWYQQGQQVTPLHTKIQERENVTVSSLLLKVTREHHGRQMVCRAEHPTLPRSTLEDIYTLDILYKPNVSLTLGRSLDSQTLREGNDIFFECHVDANPPPYKVKWIHQDKELFHNVSGGVLVSESTLALQKVHLDQSGDYKCLASNVEGDSHSNVVTVKIKYSPRCAVSPSLRGVALFELTNITCEVDADPSNVSFKWTFHNSVRRDQSQVVSSRRYTQEGLTSTLSYTPMSERDYGTLLCFATNDVGPQMEPCSFTIISAGPPEEVSNCTVGNITSHSASISCAPGFDGGLPQRFLLQIWETPVEKLVLNITAALPTFMARPLDPGRTYRAKVVAYNTRGRSSPSKLIILTLKNAEMRKSLPSMVPPSPSVFIMGVVGGIIVVTGLFIIAILCWVKIKMKPPAANIGAAHAHIIIKDNNPDLISVEASGESLHIRENGSSKDLTSRGFPPEPSSYQRYEEDDSSLYGSYPMKTTEKSHASAYSAPLLQDHPGEGFSSLEGRRDVGGIGCLEEELMEDRGRDCRNMGRVGGGTMEVSYMRGTVSFGDARRTEGVGGGGGLRERLNEEADPMITEEEVDLAREMTVRLFSGGLAPKSTL